MDERTNDRIDAICESLDRISKSLEILCDLLADAMTETDNLTEQDEPTALFRQNGNTFDGKPVATETVVYSVFPRGAL